MDDILIIGAGPIVIGQVLLADQGEIRGPPGPGLLAGELIMVRGRNDSTPQVIVV